jgi:kinesin family protein 3/17
LKKNADSVKVAIRCRPLSDSEIKKGCKSAVKVDQLSGQVTVQNAKAPGGEKMFTFDTVFGCETKQVDLYNEVARPIIESVLEGYNGESVL